MAQGRQCNSLFTPKAIIVAVQSVPGFLIVGSETLAISLRSLYLLATVPDAS